MMTTLNASKYLLPVLLGIFLIPEYCPKAASAQQRSAVPAQAVPGPPITVPLRSPLLVAQQNSFTSFFEEGRVLSENQLKPPASTLPVDTNSQYWQPIFFTAGGCSFWMPPGTLTEETVVLPTQVGAVSFRTLAANSQKARYLVAYADELTDSQLKNPQSLLAAIVNRIAPARQFTLTKNQPISLSNSQGRELSFQGATEIIVFRAYLKGNRAYVVGARSPKAEGNPARKTTYFLNSFQFLNP